MRSVYMYSYNIISKNYILCHNKSIRIMISFYMRVVYFLFYELMAVTINYYINTFYIHGVVIAAAHGPQYNDAFIVSLQFIILIIIIVSAK